MTCRAGRLAVLSLGLLLAGCGANGAADGAVSGQVEVTTEASTVPTTAPLAVVTKVTEPTTIVAAAGRKPVSDVAMEAGVVYTAGQVAGSDADLTFTAPSPTSFPYAVQFMLAISKDKAGAEGLMSVFLLNRTSRFFKDSADDPAQLTNMAQTLAATDPIGDDLFAQFEQVAGMTTRRLPGTQQIGGVQAEVLEYRIDDALADPGPCGAVQCLITLYVPGAALAHVAGETGRLALVTVGGSTLLLAITDDPITEQIVSTMKLVAE